MTLNIHIDDALSVKTHDDTAEVVGSMLNVKVHLVGDDGALCGLRGRCEEHHERKDQCGEEGVQGEARHGDVSM